ncbi:hypothetical protein [Halorubrum aethiopicum]|uniref:hypothetical protein n=1 Tax=Halorubrum aethiopicum TaxID=1758255 RepID=UPI00082D93D6|nr:hypothetical protein [Halorubrum aethiopicum]
MQTTFTSQDEAREALTVDYGISEKNVDALFDAVDTATESLIDEYGLHGEVDTDTVQRWLQIGSAENIAWFVDEGVLAVDELDGFISDLGVSEMETVAGRVATRNRDLMRLSESILSG